MLISISLIIITCIALNAVFRRLQLPALLAYLLLGILFGPYVLNWIHPDLINLSPDIRRIALIIILTRAGLSLDIHELMKVGRPALMMTFVPASIEILAAAILGPLLLGFSIIQSLITGAILAAVSPAVVVPRMVDLIQSGRGVDKQIPQVIMAGASADDVYVLVLFSAFISMAMNGTFSLFSFALVPISIILGIIVGILIGKVFNRVLDRIELNKSFQVAIILAIAFVLLFMEDHTNGYFSGMIAVIAMNMMVLEEKPDRAVKMSHSFNQLWQVAEIFLFFLVGVSVNPSYAVSAGWMPVVFIFALSVCRLFIGVNLCMMRTNYTYKERLFMMVSYLPKATVQAAIGGVPLAMGIAGGEFMLTLAVLSILITAPLGAQLIDFLSPRLFDNN